MPTTIRTTRARLVARGTRCRTGYRRQGRAWPTGPRQRVTPWRRLRGGRSRRPGATRWRRAPIAFGVGLLISGLIPSSQKEQRAVSDLQRKVEPLKEKATEAAKEVAENLREPAQQAVESVKATATQAAQNVKDEGTTAKDDVQGQVQDSAQTVRQEGSS